MPKQQDFASRIEEIKAKQRERGVVEKFRGKDYPTLTLRQKDRALLARKLIRGARKNLIYDQLGEQDAGVIKFYSYFGSHYNRELKSVKDFRSFHSFVETQLKNLSADDRLRWLDLGPGDPEKFMPYFEQIDPSNTKIDLHTLSPRQILPRETRKLLHSEYTPNFEYTKWKSRLTHHVGALETYNPKKLGKFHVIVSVMGSAAYASDKLSALNKISQMLHVGGKAFVDLWTPNSQVPEYELKEQLGDNYHVEIIPKTQGYIIITRNK